MPSDEALSAAWHHCRDMAAHHTVASENIAALVSAANAAIDSYKQHIEALKLQCDSLSIHLADAEHALKTALTGTQRDRDAEAMFRDMAKQQTLLKPPAAARIAERETTQISLP